MKNIIKICGLVAVFSMIPAAFAANATRVSVRGTPATRGSSLSIAGKIRAIATNSSYETTTQWFSSTECVENYTACLKEGDVCGLDLEECTDSVLLHAKMPSCLNVLMQCKSADVANLFGSGATMSNLYNVPSSGGTNSDDEIVKYTYPTDQSILGQMLKSAEISNRLTTPQCIKKYTSCLHKDNVCGEDFELCTSTNEFKRNAIMCKSTLARCQSEGKRELFGELENAKKLEPQSGSRLDDLIQDGAKLAATNTLATCNKVADQCILKACSKNPSHCLEGRILLGIAAGDAIADNSTTVNVDPDKADNLSTSKDVEAFIKKSCLDTIGANKYCYIVYKATDEGIDDTMNYKKTQSQVSKVIGQDIHVSDDEIKEVFESIYDYRMREPLKKKIEDLADAFDAKAKDACVATISDCAMQSCGRGLGSLCYKQVFVSESDNKRNIANGTINDGTPYEDIKKSCSAVVNTDVNCQYSYADLQRKAYNYSYIESSVFDYLFPGDTLTDDPIGVIASLNASLASSYNEAAIENMRKQCANTAISCVRGVCGPDFQNCYRNRTDVRISGAGSYQTGSAAFNKSMNKVGGVLDYNIVTGLCLNTIKNSKSCEEHLKIAAEEWRESEDKTSWGANSSGTQYESVRKGWLDSNKTRAGKSPDKVLLGCTGSEEQASLNPDCDTTTIGNCDETDPDTQCVYSVEQYQDITEYSLTNAGKTLFQEVLADIEREVQAKYNAKLTNEQNICLAKNAGGVRGSNENGSTYMWVKLNRAKVPANYSVKGLKASEFKATGDLYGAFCRVRVTMTSDDKSIQDNLKNTEAFFAVGDSFTCGSWLTQKELNDITKIVREQALKEAKGFQDGDTAKDKAALAWSAVAGFLGGGVGGFFGMDSLQRNGGSLGGLLNGKGLKQTQENQKTAKACLADIESARNSYATAVGYTDNPDSKAAELRKALNSANSAKSKARSAGLDVSDVDFSYVNGYTVARKAITGQYKISSKLYRQMATELGDLDDACSKLTETTGSADKNPLCEESGKKCVRAIKEQREALESLRTFVAEDPNEIFDKASRIYSDLRTILSDAQKVKGLTATDGTCGVNATLMSSKDLSDKFESKSNSNQNNQQQGNNGGEQQTTQQQGNKADEQKAAPIPAITAEGIEVVRAPVTDKQGWAARVEEEDALREFPTNLEKLEEMCSDVVNGESDEERAKRRNANIIAGVATSAVGSALAVGIAKTVIDVKYENIQDEAVKKWMEEIGSHIQCVIGTEEAGSYGDTVAIDYD